MNLEMPEWYKKIPGPIKFILSIVIGVPVCTVILTVTFILDLLTYYFFAFVALPIELLQDWLEEKANK